MVKVRPYKQGDFDGVTYKHLLDGKYKHLLEAQANNHEAYTALVDGKVIGLFGFYVENGQSYLWFVPDVLFMIYWRGFVRETLKMQDDVMSRHKSVKTYLMFDKPAYHRFAKVYGMIRKPDDKGLIVYERVLHV